MSCEQREGLQSDERYLFTEVLGAYPKITIRYHTSSVGSQGDRILSCSREHRQQVALVETT